MASDELPEHSSRCCRWLACRCSELPTVASRAETGPADGQLPEGDQQRSSPTTGLPACQRRAADRSAWISDLAIRAAKDRNGSAWTGVDSAWYGLD